MRWLTRNVFAIGMLSLFSDMGHELTTAVLPLFLATFGGGAAALGMIGGISDAASSLLKLWMSFYSDRLGRRKPILGIGYFLTAMMGTFAFVSAWWHCWLSGQSRGSGEARADLFGTRFYRKACHLKPTAEPSDFREPWTRWAQLSGRRSRFRSLV